MLKWHIQIIRRPCYLHLMRLFREKRVAALPLALPLFIRGIRNIARRYLLS